MPRFGIMKRILLIFALLMVASCDAINDSQCFDVTTSPANPVEFWPIDCDTYNQKEVCGVHPKCFCAPWNCSDEIKIQFIDSASDDSNFETVTFPPFNTWANNPGANPDWTTGVNPSVNVVAEQSDILFVSYPFIAGYQYIFTIDYTKVNNSGSSNPRTIRMSAYDSDFNEIDFSQQTTLADSSGSIAFEFTATSEMEFIGVSINDGSDVTMTLDSGSAQRSVPDDFILVLINEEDNELDSVDFSITEVAGSAAIVYSTSFIPSDLGVCDQKIRLEIRNVTVSPDVSISKSDCLDVRVSHPCTYLWEYWNNKNILGLVYQNVSPAQTFYIRVPMTFRIEEFPEEEEVMELTSSVEVLNSQIMEKRLVEVGYVPYYFHRKLKYILKHQFISIDGQSWVRADEYKIIEGNKKYPLKMGEVWMTEKNSVQRAVL